LQPRRIDRLEHVVERVCFERLERVPIVRRHEDDERHRLHADLLDDLERRGTPELDIEEHDVGQPFDDRVNRAVAASAFSDALDAVELRELLV
jgi:hypothetical protein